MQNAITEKKFKYHQPTHGLHLANSSFFASSWQNRIGWLYYTWLSDVQDYDHQMVNSMWLLSKWICKNDLTAIVLPVQWLWLLSLVIFWSYFLVFNWDPEYVSSFCLLELNCAERNTRWWWWTMYGLCDEFDCTYLIQ